MMARTKLVQAGFIISACPVTESYPDKPEIYPIFYWQPDLYQENSWNFVIF